MSLHVFVKGLPTNLKKSDAVLRDFRRQFPDAGIASVELVGDGCARVFFDNEHLIAGCVKPGTLWTFRGEGVAVSKRRFDPESKTKAASEQEASSEQQEQPQEHNNNDQSPPPPLPPLPRAQARQNKPKAARQRKNKTPQEDARVVDPLGVFVVHLLPDVDEARLLNAVQKHVAPLCGFTVRVLRDQMTKESRCMAFLNFGTEKDAAQCKQCDALWAEVGDYGVRALNAFVNNDAHTQRWRAHALA